MKVEWQAIQTVLVDPVTRSALRYDASQDALISSAGRYPMIGGQPNLLSFEELELGGWRFPPIDAVDQERPKPTGQPMSRAKSMRRRVRSGVGAAGPQQMLVNLVRELGRDGRPRALVVGGASIGEGSEILVEAHDIDVISFDIYPTTSTTFVADGHRIPLADASVDAVWVQAVLEHVYRPEAVVAEIVRVLRPDGLLYAETPFLQPVHEAAYDYVRFTQSGHRLLFGRFEQIVAGPLGGPATVLSLAARGLVGGLTRNPTLARLAYAVTQPLVFLDRFVTLEWRVDFAAGTFFLGRLNDCAVCEFAPEHTYRGAQRR